MTDIATLRRILAEEYGIHSDKELHDAPKNNPKVNMAARSKNLIRLPQNLIAYRAEI